MDEQNENVVLTKKGTATVETPMEDIELGISEEELNDLTPLEVAQFSDKLKQIKAFYEQCYTLLKSLEEEDNIDAHNKRIIEHNILKQFGINGTAKQYKEQYENSLSKRIEKFEELSKKVMDENKDHLNSSTGLTKDWMTILDHQFGKIPMDHANYEMLKKRYETNHSAMESRENIDFLVKKFDTYLKTNEKDIVKTLKNEKDKIKMNIRTKVVNSLTHTFQRDMILKLIYGMELTFARYGPLEAPENTYKTKDVMYYNPQITYLMLLFLDKMSKNGEKDATSIWVKLLIMNYCDIVTGIYDIGDPIAYQNSIREAFMDKADKFFDHIYNKYSYLKDVERVFTNEYFVVNWNQFGINQGIKKDTTTKKQKEEAVNLSSEEDFKKLVEEKTEELKEKLGADNIEFVNPPEEVKEETTEQKTYLVNSVGTDASPDTEE